MSCGRVLVGLIGATRCIFRAVAIERGRTCPPNGITWDASYAAVRLALGAGETTRRATCSASWTHRACIVGCFRAAWEGNSHEIEGR
jgi:hypothetical protein